MKKINKNKKFLDLLSVERNHFYVHGDLTFLDMFYEKNKNRFNLIAPRGHYGFWFSYHDMGKLLFTFQEFGNVVKNSYTIAEDKTG